MTEYFDMLLKRRSFHNFKQQCGNIEKEELARLEDFIKNAEPLDKDIKTSFEIVPRSKTSLKVGEYAVLFYSEKKEGYLENIGYIGEKVDLYLESRSIGVCWYGLAKPEQTEKDGLPFAIMLAIGKVPEDSFRTKEAEFNRKGLEKVWTGEKYKAVGEIARFAPSAVNSQNWLVKESGDELEVIRLYAGVGIIPASKIEYFNKVDIGIFMLFLELSLEHFGYSFERTLEYKPLSKSEILAATYKLK